MEDKEQLLPNQAQQHQQQPPPPAYPQPQAPPVGQYPPAQIAYQQQPQPYPPPQQQRSTTSVVVGSQPPVVMAPNFHTSPVRAHCPHCQHDMMTTLNYSPGNLVWLSVAVMFLLGFWICIIIPFVMDDFKDVQHHCSVCNYKVGEYRRLS